MNQNPRSIADHELIEIERRIALGEKRIASQRELIERFHLLHVTSMSAQRLLATMIEVQVSFARHRALLRSTRVGQSRRRES